MDKFIGSVFGKDSQIEVISSIRESYKTTRYIVKCSKCAKDPELFSDGLFTSFKSALIRGQLPCGCSKRFTYSISQYETLIKRTFESDQYSFVGWEDTFSNTKRETTYYRRFKYVCKDHGEKVMSVGKWLSGQRCSECKNCCKKDTEKFIKDATEVHGDSYQYCEVDYKDSHSPVRIRCDEHGIFKQSPTNHLQGQGCPSCAIGGFDCNKPSVLYVMKCSGGLKFCGFGISNNFDLRFRRHTYNLKKLNTAIEDYKKFSMSGKQALTIENLIKSQFKILPQPVEGFVRESTDYLLYQTLVDFIECNLSLREGASTF